MDKENFRHMLAEDHFKKFIWVLLFIEGKYLNRTGPIDKPSRLLEIGEGEGRTNSIRILCIIPILLSRNVWLERNRMIFNNLKLMPYFVIIKLRMTSVWTGANHEEGGSVAGSLSL